MQRGLCTWQALNYGEICVAAMAIRHSASGGTAPGVATGMMAGDTW
jgi:hypothetical protein